jgi:hypothetical protein
MNANRLTPALLTVTKVAVLDSFESQDFEGLRVTLVTLRDSAEPYRYREVKSRGYFGVDFFRIETPALREYCGYLDECLADLDRFEPEIFDQLISEVINTMSQTAWMSKQLSWQGDHDRMKLAREAREYDDTPIAQWYHKLSPSRRDLSVRGLAEWMLDRWDTEFEEIKPPSERTLRRILTRLKKAE